MISINIADARELRETDRLLRSLLALDDVGMDSVRRFVEQTAPFPSALEYSSALAEYVTGILLKDQPAGSPDPQASAEKLRHALSVQRHYERPLADVVRRASDSA